MLSCRDKPWRPDSFRSGNPKAGLLTDTFENEHPYCTGIGGRGAVTSPGSFDGGGKVSTGRVTYG